MKAHAIFFSATDTNKKNTLAIAAQLGTVNEIDVTDFSAEGTSATFSPDEIVVFGSPVYGGRMQMVAKRRLAAFKGNNTPCVLTVTYGNRDYDDALLEMYDMAVANGFRPVAAAAMIGQHTFGEIQVGRPDQNDIAQHTDFAKKVSEKLSAGSWSPEELLIKGNRPYKDGGKGGSFRPSTNDSCINCGLCAAKCPTAAINPDDVSEIDNDKCISCFRCIHVCPVGAKEMASEQYTAFAKDFSARLAPRRENEYML